MNRDIRLHIEGALLEKLIQRALEEGAILASIRRTSARSITVETDIPGALCLSALCRKYGYLCREEHRGGKAALMDFLRRRWTLLPGLLLGLMLCLLFFSRIWIVDICLLNTAPDPEIRVQLENCLQSLDIRPGAARTAIDTALLQKQLLSSAPSCSHIGVRLQGIRLLVEASAEIPAPETHVIGHARDLVALRSGVIEDVHVYSGSACIHPGDTVLRGETLIRGEEIVGKDTQSGETATTAVRALGKVNARCWFEGHASAPLQRTIHPRSGNMRRSARLRLGKWIIPISECAPFSAQETETRILPIVGMFIPLQVEYSIHYETIPQRESVDPDALANRLSAIARADALRQINAEVRDYKILSGWTDVSQTDNTLHIRAVYEISTDIAATRDALIEEVY